MKIFKAISLALFTCILIFSCSQENEPLDLIMEDETQMRKPVESKMVTVPFKANFYTKRNYDNMGEGVCTEEPYTAFNYQVGAGNSTHLGNFIVTIEFCGEDGGFTYKDGTGVFVAANGDELWMNVPSSGEIGVISWDFSNPPYELHFQDSWEITGGTGRFEGASGNGYTDSWVDLLDDEGNFLPEHQTDHMFDGEITFKPGSKSK